MPGTIQLHRERTAAELKVGRAAEVRGEAVNREQLTLAAYSKPERATEQQQQVENAAIPGGGVSSAMDRARSNVQRDW